MRRPMRDRCLGFAAPARARPCPLARHRLSSRASTPPGVVVAPSSIPAIIRPIRSRETFGGTMPMIRPRYMTAIRSPRASTSSSSEETSSTPAPRSRSSMIRRWTYSIEPTSSPRVGCEATSWVTPWESSRATTTFCWFPPDNVPTDVSTEFARISNSVSLCSPSLLTKPSRLAPKWAYGAWS